MHKQKASLYFWFRAEFSLRSPSPTSSPKFTFLIKFIKARPHTGFTRFTSFSPPAQYLILAGNPKCALNRPLCTHEGHHFPTIGQFIKHLSVAFWTGRRYTCHSAALAGGLEYHCSAFLTHERTSGLLTVDSDCDFSPVSHGVRVFLISIRLRDFFQYCRASCRDVASVLSFTISLIGNTVGLFYIIALYFLAKLDSILFLFFSVWRKKTQITWDCVTYWNDFSIFLLLLLDIYDMTPAHTIGRSDWHFSQYWSRVFFPLLSAVVHQSLCPH